MGFFRRGPDRILSDPIDSEVDWAKQEAAAHRDHDASRRQQPVKRTRGRSSDDVSGPSSPSASTPKRGRRW
ncbi:hypothetical protein ACWCPS_29915 [Streptomyces mauvecolor]